MQAIPISANTVPNLKSRMLRAAGWLFAGNLSAQFLRLGDHIHHSIVMPETYVVAELELDRVIARRPLLINTSLGSRTEIVDPELLAYFHQAPRATRHVATDLGQVLRYMFNGGISRSTPPPPVQARFNWSYTYPYTHI